MKIENILIDYQEKCREIVEGNERTLKAIKEGRAVGKLSEIEKGITAGIEIRKLTAQTIQDIKQINEENK